MCTAIYGVSKLFLYATGRIYVKTNTIHFKMRNMTLTTMMVIYNTKLGCEFVSAALSLTVFYTKKIIYDDNIDNYS